MCKFQFIMKFEILFRNEIYSILEIIFYIYRIFILTYI